MAQRRSRPRPRGSSRSGGAWLFLLGLLVGAGALYLFVRQPPSPAAPPEPREREEAPAPRQAARAESSPASAPKIPSEHVEPAANAPVTTVPAPPSGPVRGVRVALVIDDLGTSVEELRPLEGLGVPVTFSVLPYGDQTPAVVAELRQRGEEILLHLPMEPKNGENPGPGALLAGMTDAELKEKTLAALKAVPGAVGVNNHMGSLLSTAEGPMTAVLRVLAGRGLFFLDSRTSAESVGYKVARELGIPAAERQVFLDGDPTPEAIATQFQRLLGLARAHGVAIAIGHPHPETLAALQREVPKARAEGYEFVPVSYLLTRTDGE
ncbi:MAG TPA: divergent polysaccharide deacetylase family protein [Thermoanaerobaculia bacterium]|nr:divergent polysaccharide deacetylase family protein [Thermoanaerobaculia bacterium]